MTGGISKVGKADGLRVRNRGATFGNFSEKDPSTHNNQQENWSDQLRVLRQILIGETCMST